MHKNLRRLPAALLALPAAISIFLAPVPARSQINAEQVMIIGRNVLSMEDYLLAIQYFNQAIKGKPYLADPYYYRGLAKLSLDDFEGAVADETRALERNKYKSEAYKVRGFALQSLGRDSLALLDYDKGLEYDPTDRYFLFYKGVAQTSLKRYEQADTTFAALLKAYPKFEDAWTARARLNIERGDTVAALEDIDRSLRLSKSLINSYLIRAQISADRKEWAAALTDMDEAIRIRPEESDLYVNRAFLRYNNEDFFGAMADYNYALELQPDNMAALFNRALLRFEVKELDNAAADFTSVLDHDSDNFHARYNRGLVYLELERNRDARGDFEVIAARYPRFYPVYYALAECDRRLGNLKSVGNNLRKAESLVTGYVADPQRNPLDRPKIEAGASRDAGGEENLTEEQVMDRFNRLVTTSAASAQTLSFNDRINGRVQDRSMSVSPEPAYSLSLMAPQQSLQNSSNYFRELDDINQRHLLSDRLYLVSGDARALSEIDMRSLFAKEETLSQAIAAGAPRPVDRLARGVLRTMLKNYEGALEDFSAAVEAAPDFVTALLGRAFVQSVLGRPQLAVADLDEALRIDPQLVFAWFNKGLIYYNEGDYTSAMQAFGEAIRLDTALGSAYYNRGLCYMHAGNRKSAFADLSKAGELGVLPSYQLLKRMK